MFNNSLTNRMRNSWWKQCCFTATQLCMFFQTSVNFFVSVTFFFSVYYSPGYVCIFLAQTGISSSLGSAPLLYFSLAGFAPYSCGYWRIKADTAWSCRAFLSIFSSKVKTSYSDLWEISFRNEICCMFISYPSYVRCKKEMKHLVSTSVRV